MREALFIKRNAEKWKKYQEEPPEHPDETAERFITLMDDLSYARTFYPRSKLTQWINGLAASMYQQVYQNRKEKYSQFFYFWKFSLPLICYKHRNIMGLAAVFFILAALIGWYSAAEHPAFMREVLSDDYVNMTEDNIARGDPFGVYKEDGPFNMFIRIAVNNIRVSFLTFMGGFSAGLFTLYLLWTNGLMLGCFQYMFYAHDLGWPAVWVIWIHGTLEIASIIIAGSAGLILAKGMLLPATYTRYQSFRLAVTDAVRLLLSLIPFFILAAWLESYITQRMSETFDNQLEGGWPVWASAMILAGSFMLIAFYFYWWPRKLVKKNAGFEKPVHD